MHILSMSDGTYFFRVQLCVQKSILLDFCGIPEFVRLGLGWQARGLCRKISRKLSGSSPGSSLGLSRRLSGALRKPSGDSLRQSGFGITFKGKSGQIMLFFCKSDATDHFRRRMAKATCTKYRACEQKLAAVFANGSSVGPGRVLATPPEPLV